MLALNDLDDEKARNDDCERGTQEKNQKKRPRFKRRHLPSHM